MEGRKRDTRKLNEKNIEHNVYKTFIAFMMRARTLVKTQYYPCYCLLSCTLSLDNFIIRICVELNGKRDEIELYKKLINKCFYRQ